MGLVQTTDFIGEYKVSQSVYGDLSLYIEKYEKHYLMNLMGADLYNLFVADLTATTPQVPQTQRFLDIYNSFDIDKDSCIRSSEGMVKMLVQFIYFHYVRDTNYEQTDSGVMRTVSEVSSILPYNGYNLIESYNQGVKNYKEIQWFICDYTSVYPEENVQLLEYSCGI